MQLIGSLLHIRSLKTHLIHLICAHLWHAADTCHTMELKKSKPPWAVVYDITNWGTERPGEGPAHLLDLAEDGDPLTCWTSLRMEYAAWICLLLSFPKGIF